MSLHPVFQLEIDGTDVTVEPRFIQSMTYKSSIEALSTLDFTVIDPTFTTVEDLLLDSDEDQIPIFSRFGYLDEQGKLTSNWLQSRLINFSPRLTEKGMEITASTLVDVGGSVVQSKGGVYSGKISDVVQQIAEEIGLEYEIEETDDDFRLADPENRGSPTLWTTKGYTSFRFIEKDLVPIARSKTGQSNYELRVTGVGSRTKKPILHFHTKEFPNCEVRKKAVKEFTYLAGSQDQVLEFTPDYNSSLLGNLGGGQVVMRAYDPLTKRYVSSVQNYRNNPDSISFGDGDKTNSPTITEAGENEDLASQGGYLMSSEATEASAIARARNRWELLKAFSFTASLTLVGLPDYPGTEGTGTVDIEANDLVRVNVLIPGSPGDVANPPYKKHWSSGLYLVTEAIHLIESQYTVTCQLRRDLTEIGAEVNSGSKYVPPNE